MLEDDLLNEYERLHGTLNPGAYEEFARLAMPRLLKIARRGLRIEESTQKFLRRFAMEWNDSSQPAAETLGKIDEHREKLLEELQLIEASVQAKAAPHDWETYKTDAGTGVGRTCRRCGRAERAVQGKGFVDRDGNGTCA